MNDSSKLDTETAKPLGALLPGIAGPLIEGTVSPERSIAPHELMDLTSLPDRLENSTLAVLRDIANSALPTSVRCDEVHFGRCLKALDILPRRADETGGALRFKLYQRHLGGFSDEAMSHLVEQATATCHWFPTIAECLEILKAWPNRDVAIDRQARAKHLIQREMDTRLGEVLKALEREELDQAGIDALPDQWKRIAATKSLLWGWPDGRFTLRRDLSRLAPEEAETEREKNKAMFAEWERIEAEIAEVKGSAAE